ncbi:hypothetical protein [Lysobacter sp. FW306-1B-D06B]|uniref:hypothetical protein n=1 Tax=Lysobacter sp. FW306-1B-D06B TaxID=3140250 RepID=UPI0031406807
MEVVVHRSADGTVVVERDGRYFIHYDAGSHQIIWREDEVSAEELEMIRSGPEGLDAVLWAIQRKLLAAGDAYCANWTPTT